MGPQTTINNGPCFTFYAWERKNGFQFYSCKNEEEADKERGETKNGQESLKYY